HNTETPALDGTAAPSGALLVAEASFPGPDDFDAGAGSASRRGVSTAIFGVSGGRGRTGLGTDRMVVPSDPVPGSGGLGGAAGACVFAGSTAFAAAAALAGSGFVGGAAFDGSGAFVDG